MICFKDQTFCNAECLNLACRRNYTAKERAAAAAWGKRAGFEEGGAPVSFADFSPTCPDYQKPALPFDEWWAELVDTAERQGLEGFLSTEREDHREGWEEGSTPDDELGEQISAAGS